MFFMRAVAYMKSILFLETYFRNNSFIKKLRKIPTENKNNRYDILFFEHVAEKIHIIDKKK